MRMLNCMWVCIFLAAQGSPALADENLASEIQQLRRAVQELTQVVQEQQKEIEVLKRANVNLGAPMRKQPAASTIPQFSAAPVPRKTAPAGRLTGLEAFNPEIGMVADVTAQLTQSSEDGEGNDKISVRELELVLGHDIDPYCRFDAVLSFSDFGDPGVGEAYVSHWGLPWELRGRIGRIRPKVGKATAIHRGQLDTVDEPRVVEQYLGHHGLHRTGVELSRLFMGAWDSLTHEATVGVMEGGRCEGGEMFGTTRRIPSYYTHLKNFIDISDETSFELGATYLKGSRDDDSRLEVDAVGADTTLIHYVTPTNKLKWQNEAYFQFRDETAAGTPDHPFGFYSLVDYRLSPRLGVGGRFDYVEPVDPAASNPRDADTALSAYLTFYQSEFARWRVQYKHVEEADGGNDDQLLLQGTFAIGVHKHQLQ